MKERFVTLVRFVGSVVIVGIVINLASDHLADRFPLARQLLVQLALMVLLVWFFILLSRLILSYIVDGRYAVEALILDANDRLLLYRHPTHRTMLPPGGRVKRSEFPHVALERRLSERLALHPSAYNYDGRFHPSLDSNHGNLGEVQRFPAPFIVQQELRKQRGLVHSHYDLVYVLKLTGDSVSIYAPHYSPVHFVDLAALTEMTSQGRTLPDVLDAYRRVLGIALGGDPS